MSAALGRQIDVRLPGNENSNSHGARRVHLIMKLMKWIRTGRLSIKNFLCAGVIREARNHTHLGKGPGRRIWCLGAGFRVWGSGSRVLWLEFTGEGIGLEDQRVRGEASGRVRGKNRCTLLNKNAQLQGFSQGPRHRSTVGS